MVLFVDINDVCRAPLAAYWYTELTGQRAHSAGVYAQEDAALGAAVCPAVLAGHLAKPLSEAMLEKADIVWCVTAAIARHLMQEHPTQAHKIHAMTEDIADSFGLPREAYERCEREIHAQVEAMQWVTS